MAENKTNMRVALMASAAKNLALSLVSELSTIENLADTGAEMDAKDEEIIRATNQMLISIKNLVVISEHI